MKKKTHKTKNTKRVKTKGKNGLSFIQNLAILIKRAHILRTRKGEKLRKARGRKAEGVEGG